MGRISKDQNGGIRASLALAAAVLCAATGAHAAPALPEDFTVEGRLFDATGVPLNTSVDLKLELVDETQPSCVLYRELRPNVDVSSTDQTARGVFSLRLGAVTPDFSAMPFTTLFAPGAMTGENCVTPATAGSHRLVRVSVKKSSDATYEALTPDTRVTAVPLAKVAENALSLGGLTANAFLQLNGSTSLKQTNFDYLFTSANYAKLQSLVDGNSAQYVPSTPTAALAFNTQRLTQVGAPTAATDAVNKTYADTTLLGSSVNVAAIGPMTGDGAVLHWDATANKWVAGLISSTPTGAAGGDLSGTYPNPSVASGAIGTLKIADGAITSAKLSPGSAVNRLLITDATTGATIGFGGCAAVDQVFAWTASGWACTLVSSLSPVTSVAGKIGAVTLNAADVSGLGTAALKDAGTAAGQVVTLNAAAQLPAVDAAQLYNVNANRIATRAVASTAPTAAQVLGWNQSTTQWEPTAASAGTVTNVTAGLGMISGTITGAGTLNVDVGTLAFKIPQLNANGQMALANRAPTAPTYSFAADTASGLYYNGGLNLATAGTARMTILTSGAIGIGTSSPAYALDVGGTIRAANSLCIGSDCRSSWPSTAGLGTVTSVTSANADIAVANTTSTPVLTLNSGTVANAILKLNGSAQIPAVDASLLTNLTAANLTGTISAARLPAVSGDVTSSAGTFLTVLSKIAGTPLTVSSLTAGQVLRYNGSAWVNAALASTDLADGPFVRTNQLPASCPATATLTYTSPTGTWTCATIVVDGSSFGTQTQKTVFAAPTSGNGTASFRALTAADLPSGTLTGSAGTAGFLPYYSAPTTLANSLLYTSGTQVGINTTSPAAVLDVNGTVRTKTLTVNGDANVAGSTNLNGYTVVAGPLVSQAYFVNTYNTQTPPGTSGGFALGWNRSNGNAEVNFWNTYNSAPTAYVFSAKNGTGINDAVDLVKIYGPANVATSNLMMDVNGGMRAIQYYNTSDRRLKHDIAPLADSLETITQMRGVSYLWNDPRMGRGVQIGLIAQEVEERYPAAVTTGPDGFEAVDYAHLIAPVIEAIKELYAKFKATDVKVDADHARLERLELENADLRARLDRLESQSSH